MDSLGSWDINVTIAHPTDDGFLLCVSIIDVSDTLPAGRYVFHQMEACSPQCDAPARPRPPGWGRAWQCARPS